MARMLAVITGASSGIGAVFARRLAADYDLLLIARRKDKLDELARELAASSGAQVETLAADLTADADLAAVAQRLREAPRLGLLVNNAGFGTSGRFWEAPLEGQERMHRLHIIAVVRLCHAALGNMVPRNSGAIINVASVAAFARGAGSASYCATKSWMTSFTEALYLELRGMQSNVSVQALCPGFTYSEFHDAMGVEREKLAPRSLWMSAENVVDASLDGLRRRKLFVIPGWQYRLMAAALTKLPTGWRLALESGSGRKGALLKR